MSEIIETKIPLIWYNPKLQIDQCLGIVNWVGDNCFNATILDPNNNIFYKEYDPETFKIRTIILDNKEE